MEKDGFFAASNSGRGFHSYYGEVFGKADRLYIIKGGPGTGKSRFMGDVAAYAVGRGYKRENYYCSSDAGSLDGVILERDGSRVALIDGTPPHTYEPSLPGARDEIINLGAFWDSEKLRERLPEIEKLNSQKNAAWRRVYKWLSGCLDMCGIIGSAGEARLDRGALRDVADAVFAGCPDGDGFSSDTAIFGAVGMTGRAFSSVYIERPARLYIVRDSLLTSGALLREIAAGAEKRAHPIVMSYDVIDASRLDALLIPDAGIGVVVGDMTPDREFVPIYMETLHSPPENDDASEIRRAEKLYDSMLSAALDALGDVSEYHFKLEKIYAGAMDFDAKESYTAEFCRKVFGE